MPANAALDACSTPDAAPSVPSRIRHAVARERLASTRAPTICCQSWLSIAGPLSRITAPPRQALFAGRADSARHRPLLGRRRDAPARALRLAQPGQTSVEAPWPALLPEDSTTLSRCGPHADRACRPVFLDDR